LNVDVRAELLNGLTITHIVFSVTSKMCYGTVTEQWVNIMQTTEHWMNQTAFLNKLIREAFC